ncbi:MAG: hypothetical protein HOE80_03595 [Candidatus Magasanikbacteria bacterium]|jgi:hypothetical protein|nr:hypothetical protein [Candidatus Magasanikbacteria bacterium]MBT4071780.1 hypothetical protein [Candidatus Magasanikbacteria bacterium]
MKKESRPTGAPKAHRNIGKEGFEGMFDDIGGDNESLFGEEPAMVPIEGDIQLDENLSPENSGKLDDALENLENITEEPPAEKPVEDSEEKE